jgi:hypothetical protein
MLEGESTPKENKKNKDVPIAMTLWKWFYK